MARTYYNSSNATYSKATEIQTSKPFDTRVVADTFDDLLITTAAGYKYAYTGLVVYVVSDNCQYVYTGVSGKLSDIKNSEKWVKLGGSSDSSEFDPSDYLEYYRENLGLGASVVNSVDELTSDSIKNAYVGMLAVVNDDQATSEEDETGLYILTDSDHTQIGNWMKIVSAAGSSDVSSVITTNGTAPSSSNGGISINSNDTDAPIQETYVIENVTAGKDTTFVAGTWYTSRGFHSISSDNDLEYGDEINALKIYNNATSVDPAYIKIFKSGSTNWMELYIPDGDSTLGFNKSDVTYIENYGESDETEVTMTTDKITLPLETPIKFAVSWGMSGMIEDRYSDSNFLNSYTFGTNPGSTYDDLDIYTTTVLPVVYVYSSNGSKVQVLTEADQTQSITEEEISSLFDDESSEE